MSIMLCGARLVWRNSDSQIFVYFLSGISIKRLPRAEKLKLLDAQEDYVRTEKQGL